MTIFNIEDSTHGESFGDFETFEAAMAELRRLSQIPWDIEPNQAPCVSWRTCGRDFIVTEWDGKAAPGPSLPTVHVLSISASAVSWANESDSWQHAQLQSLLRHWLRTNRGPGYGITLLAHSDNLSSLQAELRFLAGQTYCCAEPGCHLPQNTDRLLQLATEQSISLPTDVRVNWQCMIEQGTQLKPFPRSGQATVVQQSYSYEDTTPPSSSHPNPLPDKTHRPAEGYMVRRCTRPPPP